MTNLATATALRWYAKQSKYEYERILRNTRIIEKINAELKQELSK
jgi:hypothetical protein